MCRHSAGESGKNIENPPFCVFVVLRKLKVESYGGAVPTEPLSLPDQGVFFVKRAEQKSAKEPVFDVLFIREKTGSYCFWLKALQAALALSGVFSS